MMGLGYNELLFLAGGAAVLVGVAIAVTAAVLMGVSKREA